MRKKMGIDYSTFGAPQPARNGAAAGGEYRYKFNGMETDPESKNGEGLDYTTEYRAYDARIGRWVSPDPIVKPWESPYAGFANNPIYYRDPSGLDAEDPHKNDTWIGPTTRAEGHWEHNVTTGESPSSIATERGLTLDQLASMNPAIFHNYNPQNPDPHYWDAANSANYMLHTGDQLITSAPPTECASCYTWSPSGNGASTDVASTAMTYLGLLNGLSLVSAIDNAQAAADRARIEAYVAKLEEQEQIDEWTREGIWDPNLTQQEARRNLINNSLFIGLSAATPTVTFLSGVTKYTVTFGENANQIYHTFRHIEEVGLTSGAVQNAIMKDLPNVLSQLQTGVSKNFSLVVDGQEIIYSVYKINNELLNIGRIVIPK